MKPTTRSFTIALLLFTTLQASAKQINHLQECWNKQVKPLKEAYLTFSYQEQLNELWHSPEPWQLLNYVCKGTIWCNAGNFLKQDTLTYGKRILYSKTQFDKTALLLMDYGDKELSAITQGMYQDQIVATARYSPAILINYFQQQKTLPNKETNKELAVYSITINKTIVKLYINKADNLLHKMTTFSNDDLHGNVLSTFAYNDYSGTGNLFYPQTIQIEKVNGKIKDEVKITAISTTNEAPKLLDKPAGYQFKEDKETETTLKANKYNDHIHFIDIMPAGDKIMVVEFKDFLLVAEAPLTSRNGELIISEARKIAPGKPIKYFTFGHHHPHYLGGMRAFIHKGATVLSATDSKEYLTYLANAPHTLKPDSLQLQPRRLNMQEVKDSTTITDGDYALKVYHIGKKSGHTKDYMIYYFPQEKLLFEGDLVWIAKTGDIKKAGSTQAGLYNAVKELGLDVKTIIQSWGIAFDSYKTVIPFEEVEQSVNVK